MHILIASLPDFRWEAFIREHPTVAWSPLAKANRLEAVVTEALGAAFQPGHADDFTFSTRSPQVVMADLIQEPEQLANGALGCEIQVLCREGRLLGADDRWARIRRLHGRMEPFSFGAPDLFRPQTLRAQIDGWFESQGWPSFGPPRPHRNDTPAPHYGRELLVRHGDAWQARQICPGDFQKFHPWPVSQTNAVVR